MIVPSLPPPRHKRRARCSGSRCSGRGCLRDRGGPVPVSASGSCSADRPLPGSFLACRNRIAARACSRTIPARDGACRWMASPSMVVISRAVGLHGESGARFDRHPSSSTVQAPHWLVSQPIFVPVRPTASRRKCASSSRGSTSAWYARPLTVILTGIVTRYASCGEPTWCVRRSAGPQRLVMTKADSRRKTIGKDEENVVHGRWAMVVGLRALDLSWSKGDCLASAVVVPTFRSA